MVSRIYYIFILLGIPLVLGACSKDEPVPAPESSRVLLVYVGTDNNLSGLEQEKLQALREGWTRNPSDRIIAYIDKGGTAARLIELSNLEPGDDPRELASYGTENSASGTTLSRVIEYVKTTYPADVFGLLVFSHASGWLPQGTLQNPYAASNTVTGVPEYLGANPGTASRNGSLTHQSLRGETSYDPGNSSLYSSASAGNSGQTRSIILDGAEEMELREFAAAIPDHTFDYIVFETCFMAGIEVAWELRHKTPYILASSAEIVHPGYAPVYVQATGKILSGQIREFGQAAFNYTLTYAETDLQRSATYSVIRTDRLQALASFVSENCDFLSSFDLQQIQHFDRNDYRLFFDFEDYYSRLLRDPSKRTELTRLVTEAIPWKASTDVFMTQVGGLSGFEIRQHSGLTTYIPQAKFTALNSAYLETGWASAVGGDKLIRPWIDREINAPINAVVPIPY